MFDFQYPITDRMLLPEGAAFHPISRAMRLYPRPLEARAKRWLDIAIALLALAFLIPVLPIIAAAIRIESAGPVFFRQQRLGLDGRPFTILKFRTMRAAPAPLRQATRDDPRVTAIGRWLRRTSIDEWPQFLNVLRGDMSVVGPRPHAPGTRAGGRLFEDITIRYPDRHRVRPGLTGLAQVRGWRGETDTEHKLLRRVESDLEYIETWSLALDLVIVWRTVFVVLRMRNAY